MLKVQKVSKRFGDINALNSVSLDIEKGSIFGLLGPNGAGKSTLINIISSLISPDNGEVLINEVNLKEDANACKMWLGVVPQEIALYENLSAYDNLMFWGGLYNIPTEKLKNKADELLKLVGLFDRRKDKIKTFSGGMKRRINIASSVLHSPQLLLMDEPTVGVDPQSRNYIFEIIEKLNAKGMTIIYTTHYMEEAERLCSEIAIIDAGNIVAQGTLSQLREKSKSEDEIILTLSPDSTFNEDSILENSNFNSNSNELSVYCNDIGKELTPILGKVQSAGGVIDSISTKKANLESVFLKLTGKQLRD